MDKESHENNCWNNYLVTLTEQGKQVAGWPVLINKS